MIDEHTNHIQSKSISLPTTLNLERQINPFLRLDQNTVKQTLLDHNPLLGHQRFDIFKALREWKDQFKLTFCYVNGVIFCMTACLSGKHLRFSVRNHQIVNDVSIEAKKGEIVGIFGPNGAGKTTTFQILSGILPAKSGQILFKDTDVTRKTLAQRAKLGLYYLPQDNSVFRELTVKDNLIAAIELRKDLNHGQQLNKVDETLETLSLTHVASSKAKTVSGGKEGVEIARLLVLDPEMVMLTSLLLV